MQSVPPSTIPVPAVVPLPRPALRSAPPPTVTDDAAVGEDAPNPVPIAKTAVPEVPADLVDRPGLRAALAGAPGVVLVCAPAGYGKSLLLADWARTDTTSDTAWVGVDHGDNDPRRLWAAVVAALAGCPSVPASSRLHAPWDWPAATRPEFLAELVHTLQSLPRPIRLVLDDVHELVDPEVLRGVEMLVRNRPAGLQIVMSSRFDPPLALPRLRLAGGLWELRDDRLRFSAAEAATLLERSGLRLEPAEVELLHQRTGGWAAGLRLASVAVAKAPDRDEFLTDFSGDERSIADYLAGEILARLPADILEFLRVISVSDPIPWQLAAELSGREDAGHLLDGLEHTTGLITATGRRRDEYRVQAMLRTYLAADLHRQGPTR